MRSTSQHPRDLISYMSSSPRFSFIFVFSISIFNSALSYHFNFRYDAACRVIARVTKERDDALALVQGADSRFRSSAAAASNMDVGSDSSYPGISMEIKTRISEIGVELLQQVRDMMLLASSCSNIF
jgi:hypothetical protein